MGALHHSVKGECFKSLKNIRENASTRFGLFVNIDFEAIDEPDFATKNVKLIQEAVAARKRQAGVKRI